MREGQVRSLQYDLPEDGLTITANVDGEANVYMSYTVRNPNYGTADFVTAGSGLLSYYVPAYEDARVIVHTRLFVAIAAKKDNTTFTANTTLGDHFIQIGMSNNSSVCNTTDDNGYTIWCVYNRDFRHTALICLSVAWLTQ